MAANSAAMPPAQWLRLLKDRDFVRLLEKTMPKASDPDVPGGPVPFTVNLTLTHEQTGPQAGGVAGGSTVDGRA